jgi:hypothetical protein
MERWKAWALAWLLAATLSALLLQAPSARGDELLVNRGFEDGVEGWSFVWASASPVTDPLAPETAGSQAIELAADGLKPFEIYQDIPVTVGEQYVLSGYYAVKGGQGIEELTLRITWWYADGAGAMVQVHQDDEAARTIDNLSYAFLATGPRLAQAPAQFARVRVRINPAVEGARTVYLDDFSFTGPPAPTPTPSPTPSPTQTPLPTASPSPSPEPIASPTPSPVATPSPTAVPTATEVPSTATPSPSAPTPTRTPSVGLANAGFEEADDEGRPLAWQKYGGELRRSATAKREGQFAAAFTSRTTSTKWAFQTVAVEGGDAYVLSGYALKNDANIESAYLRLSWYASSDASDQLIDSVDSTIRLTDDSPNFRFLTTGPVVAPTEAASAKVRLMLDPLSEAEGKVYFDDISFEETSMPSPSPEATQTPLSPPSDTSQGLTPSAVTPTALAGEPQPPLSPTASLPSPTVPSVTLGSPEATASRDGSSQSEADFEESLTRTPVVLYRETRPDQVAQAGEAVTAGADDGDGLSPIVLVLVTALPAVTIAAAALFVWRRSQKRARPP